MQAFSGGEAQNRTGDTMIFSGESRVVDGGHACGNVLDGGGFVAEMMTARQQQWLCVRSRLVGSVAANTAEGFRP